MISHLEGNALFDLYGSLLSSRQQEILELYFQEDLSLEEIRENLEVSKAAVYDGLKKGVAAMEKFESHLRLLERQKKIQRLIEAHPELKEELQTLFDD